MASEPAAAASPLGACLPRLADYTHMGWAEGFPGHTPGAPWVRCVQTGSYAIALDTQAMRVPHFGPLASGLSYAAAAAADNRAWQSLPPAELALLIHAGGKEYRCTAGGPWTNFAGPRALLNIGGGRENVFHVDAQGGPPLQTDRWNHLAMTYDGTALRLYLNGRPAGEKTIGRTRVPGTGGLAFGRRQDNSGDGYHFRGAIDEVRLYDRALTPEDINARAAAPAAVLAGPGPLCAWSFRADGQAAETQPGQAWNDARMVIALRSAGGDSEASWESPPGRAWTAPDWQEVALVLRPGQPGLADDAPSITVTATEIPTGTPRPVEFEPRRGWHRVNLDGIEPLVPREGLEGRNDAMERVRLVLNNRAAEERIARLLFEKSQGAGIRTGIGAPITGVSAVLRDACGQPTGIPVQLSKNWHGRPEGGVYAGLWFHGISQVRLPPGATVELELTLVYGHWGGVPAASHAQLCLIGWGSNQLWDQSALGSWGESICYEPDQAQAHAAILDVRPLMIRSMNNNQPWGWTHNVGGGDFFRLFDVAGRHVLPVRMKTAYLRQGPVLTEVVYAGAGAGGAIAQSATVSLYRTDDIVRGIYRLRLEVKEPVSFSRFVIFQIGADTYSYTGEKRMALGNELGLSREWNTQWGGGLYRTEPMACTGRVPWISLHEAVPRAEAKRGGAWANRGVVIRAWRARLGGQDAAPWAAEFGVKARGSDTSTLDLVPPPGVTRLLPGDTLEATVEHTIVPQFAADYYGPNAALRAALEEDGNTWRMILREALGNDLRVEVTQGVLEARRPTVRIRAEQGRAEFAVTGGLGYVPITLAGLRTPVEPRLEVREPGGEWRPVDQSVHGNDFWQTDHDAAAGTWEVTFSVPADAPGDQSERREYRFGAGAIAAGPPEAQAAADLSPAGRANGAAPRESR